MSKWLEKESTKILIPRCYTCRMQQTCSILSINGKKWILSNIKLNRINL